MAAPDLAFHRATPAGGGGIAIFELYGPGAGACLAGLFRPRLGRLPGDGEVRLGTLVDPSGSPIDEVLVTRIPAGESWCGLPSWSISAHGGGAIAGRLRSALAASGGEESDRAGIIARAVAAGALGTIEGEALLLLPEALTGRAARYLLAMAAGELTDRLREILEVLDRSGAAAARERIEALEAGSAAARALVTPRRVLLAGRPNAGKSSLFNRLAERERAAVSPTPGTTRDLLEATVAIDGYPVVFLDSAGLRPYPPEDAVEREGMRRAREAATDLVLFLIDRAGPPADDERAFLEAIPPGRCLVVRTKADLRQGGGAALAGEGPPISARTGEGLDLLRGRIREAWLGPPEGRGPGPAPFTGRQALALRRVAVETSVDGLRDALVESFPDLGPTPSRG